MQDRLYYFDNVKTSVIILIAAFHCAMSYMTYAPEWWYVLDGQNAIPFTWFVIWADNFIMPIMFFVSGFFGLQSLRDWSAAVFWRKKFHRIGLPWLIGMILFVPGLIWLWFFSRNMPITFYDLIVKQYFGPFYQQGVYWYLSALLALYFILFCAIRIFPKVFRSPSPINKSKKPINLCLFLYLAAATPAMFMLNIFYPDTVWINFYYVLLLQITRVPLYLASFLLGAYFYGNNLLADNELEKNICFKPQFMGPVFIIFSILFVYFRMNFSITNTFAIFCNALIHCSFCLVSLLTALCVFKKYFNKTNKFLMDLASLSYGIYFIHQNIVQSIVLYMRQIQLQIYIKYSISTAISLIACYLICKGAYFCNRQFKDMLKFNKTG